MKHFRYRIIPALVGLLLPLSLHAAETSGTPPDAMDAATQAPETAADEAIVSETTSESADSETTSDNLAAEALTDATSETDSGTSEATNEPATEAVAEAPKSDGTFTITAFEIEGNNLLATEAIEAALQGFLGEGKSRQDLFSIRYAVIKAYRKAELKGVAVAVPTTGPDQTVAIKIFEDDINIYPDQSKKQVERPVVAATTSESTPAATDKPSTFAVNGVTKPDVATEENLARQQEVQQQLATGTTAEGANQNTSAASTQATEIQSVQEEAELDQEQKEPEAPAEVAVAEPKKSATAQAEKPSLKRAAEKIEKKQVAAEKQRIKPAAEKRTSEKKHTEVAKKTTTTPKSAAASVEKKRPEPKLAKSEAEKRKVAQEVDATSTESGDLSMVSAKAMDAKQGTFNIASFEIYGNHLIKTEAIEKLIQPHVGAGKSYADLVAVKKSISELYRSKGHRMVAVGLPGRIFNEDIPIRIYEAKRRR